MENIFENYKKEYNDILEKKQSLEFTIKQKAKEMVNKQPYIKTNKYENSSTVSELFDNIDNKIKTEYKTAQFLRIINVIEQYNKNK